MSFAAILAAPIPPIMRIVAVALGSYLIGCVVAAFYVVRLRSGTDIRASGSGTAGARNVLRTHGRLSAALTLLLDASKGAAAVLLAGRFADAPWAAGLAFLFVVIGHVWPVQLGFRGGKGAAPSLGAMLAISPAVTAIGLLVVLLAWLITRDVTRSGLLGIGAAPVAYAALHGPGSDTLLVAASCGIVLVAHHPMISRGTTAQHEVSE